MSDLQQQLEATLDWLVIKSLAGTALDREVTRLGVLLETIPAGHEARPEMAKELADATRRLDLVRQWKPGPPSPQVG
jgi:hypothetical protein